MINKSKQKTPMRKETGLSFKEINLGYNEEEALNEANRCLNCKNAPCTSGCPVHNDIPMFIKLITLKEYDDSYNTLLATSGLSSICSRVCYQDKQCEKNCNRKKTGESVAIGALERFVSEKFYNKLDNLKQKEIISRIKVAIIGSGPSGLACASRLSRNGIKVDVYEKEERIGGMLSYGIPKYRLPDKVVDQLFEELKLYGVSFYMNTNIDEQYLIKLAEKYDYLYIATGSSISKKMHIEGENSRFVIPWDSFLKNVDRYGDAFKNRKIAIFGGGNVAVDCARSAIRLNASNVSIIYRRTIEQMPANYLEIMDAKLENVKIIELANPELINEKDSGVEVKMRKMVLGDTDQDGRKSFHKTNDFFTESFDYVIMAIGSEPNSLFIDKNLLNEYGYVVTDDKFQTNDIKIYAGGDLVSGPKTVVEAVNMGNGAANSILEKISN